MKKDKEDKLLDHDYDGIRELDNRLPPWWLKLFYITIIWAVAYFVYYHVLDIGDSQIEAYNKEMGYTTSNSGGGLSIFKGYQTPYSKTPPYFKKYVSMDSTKALAEVTENEKEETAAEATYELVTDKAGLQNGAKVFHTNCIPCHGVNGEGGIGPNLTDNYWINGDGSFNAIVKVIQNGVPVKGMISWKPLLKEKDLIDVASHVYNLRGTHPANPKAPQGKKYTK